MVVPCTYRVTYLSEVMHEPQSHCPQPHVHPMFCMYVGMSESSGPHSLCKMDPNWWNPVSVGKDMAGVQTKIFQPDSNGEGEVYTQTYFVIVESPNNGHFGSNDFVPVERMSLSGRYTKVLAWG